VNQALRKLLWIVLFALATGISLRAQEAAPTETPPRNAAVEEIGLATRYLPDENGKLVPVPGITYERFRELLLLESRAGVVEPPPVTIDQFTLSGTQQGELVKLDVAATIQLRKSGWTMVPLRLNGSLLRDEIEVDQATKLIHRYDAKEGHQLWLSAASQPQAKLRIPLITRLTLAGSERQLVLPLPKASVSELSLVVPEQVDDATLRGGEGIVSVASEEKGTSTLQVIGAAGDLSLVWQRLDKQRRKPSDLEVSADITARIETRNVARLEATFHVTRSSMGNEPLRVRLPVNTQWIPQTTRGYVVSEAPATETTDDDDADDEAAEAQPEAGQVVQIEFDRPSESADFSLAATYSPSPDAADTAMELGGFEVLGARRQTGFVSVFLPAEWSLKGTPSAEVFRTDDAAMLPGQVRPRARYRFIHQPFSLLVEASPQPPRTVVEPTFAAVVEATRVTMAGTLSYQVRGPRPEELEIDLGDWVLDNVGPVDLVTLEPGDDDAPAKLRLQPGMSTDFTLQLEMHRNVSSDTVEINFGLPKPVATQVLPATLTVSSADNIALAPQTDDMRALVVEDRGPALTLPTGGQRPLVFRELLSGAERPRFVATFQVRKRRVTATLTGRVSLDEQRAGIEQRLALNIAYEPLRMLWLEAPAETTFPEPRVYLGEQLLAIHEEALDSGTDASAQRRWRVELPNPVTGDVGLVVHYALTIPPSGPLDLPLVAPLEVDGLVVAHQQVTVESRAERRYLFDEEMSRDPSVSLTKTPLGMQLDCPRRLAVLPLRPEAARSTAGAALRLERVWFQTWLSPTRRRDRFVAQIVGSADRVQIVLPEEVASQDIRVLVDGQAPREVQKHEQILSLALEATALEATAQPRHTLELWYLLPRTPVSGPARVPLALPKILDASAAQQTFVQVLVPGGEQVLAASANVVPQQAWRKSGWWWEYAGRLSSEQLEAWAGATQAEAGTLPARDALFMTLGSVESVEVVILGRRWLWLLAAGSVVVLGMLLLQLPGRQAARVLAGVALLGLVVGLLTPELALGIAPFLGVSLLLLGAIAWSVRLVGQPAPQKPMSASPSTLSRKTSLNRPSYDNIASTAAVALPKSPSSERASLAREGSR
jgi:hypothetical protein